MSFVAQILQPGGGILVIPFIRSVIMCLFLLTSTAFIAGIARVHMAILAFLAGCLLLSISFFMSEYDKVVNSDGRSGSATVTTATTTATGQRDKTD